MFSDKREVGRNEFLQNRIIYSLPVRLGLWNEELALREERNLLTSYKKEHCQLLIQKSRRMFRNALRPTTLSSNTSYVLYGQNYQIKALDVHNNPCGKKDDGLYLSGLLNDRLIDQIQHFKHGALITASPSKAPCVRNTFKISGCGANKDGQQVVYGEDILIQISESANDIPLFVQCENDTIDSFGGHLTLRFSQSPDIYCRFKIFHWNPQWRYETTGTTFSPNSRVIIQHTASGRNLAVEHSTWVPTFFGPECAVSCHTYRDSHKMETAENFWTLASTPDANTALYVRAAKGEDIPTELLN